MTAILHTLKHQFLISMPHLHDPNFDGALTYICDHNEHGAMGVIINRPLGISLGEIFEQLQLDGANRIETVYAGGPVQIDRGFVIHRPKGPWQATLAIDEGIYLTTSKDILVACAQHEGPKDMLVALGYAGWGAGQLENEIANNYWLNCPADEEILFHTPSEKRLEAAVAKLGISLAQLAPQAGHA